MKFFLRFVQCLLLSLSAFLLACSAADPQLSSLSSVSLFSTDQSLYTISNKTNLSVTGRCNSKLKSISIYKSGSLVNITNLASIAAGSGSFNCLTNGTFSLILNNLDTTWGMSSLDGSYTLVGNLTDTFSDTKSFSVHVLTGTHSSLSLLTTKATSGSGNVYLFRMPAKKAASASYKYRLRFK